MAQDLTPGVDLPTDASHFGRYRRLFTNRDFRLWFGSATISSLGDWAGLFALQALVASLSADQSRIQLFSLGAIMMARTLPSLLIGPLAGVFADRYDRKHLMVGTDLARAALFVTIAFTGDLIALFALTFIVESMSLLFASAKDATLGALVDRDDLTEASQLNLTVTYGTLPLGGLMGLLLAALSSLLAGTGLQATTLVLLLNAITFVVSAVLMSRLSTTGGRRRRAAAPDEPPTNLFRELRGGLSFIRRMPVVRALILGVIGIFFGGGVIFALGPALFAEEQWFTVVTLVGVGLVVGMLLSPVLAARIPKERVLGVGMVATALLASAIAVTFSFAWMAGLAGGLGVAAGLAFVVGYSLLHEQTYADDETRGTTFATFYTGTRAAMFTALGVAPLVAGAIGRFSISVAQTTVSLSGLRMTILAGGLLGLWTAVNTMRALWGRQEVDDDEPTVSGVLAPEAHGGGRGLLIAFEGVEGAGKTTQVELLAQRLREEGRDVLVTREPGGHPIGERIRELLLDPASERMHERTEALLYSAARAQLVAEVIQPALDAGKIVLSDRFVDSSLVYQGGARGLGVRQIAEINQWATGGLRPDVVVWLQLEPSAGLARVDSRLGEVAASAWENGTAPNGRDRLESEPVGFHESVAEQYARLARSGRRRWVTVDARGAPDAVAQRVREALARWLDGAT